MFTHRAPRRAASATPASGSGVERRTHGTRGLVACLTTGATLLALSGSTRNGWLVLLAGFCLGLVLAAVVLGPRLDRLDVDVSLPARATVGEPVVVSVVVRNDGRRGTPASTLLVRTPRMGEVSVAVPALRTGQSATAEATAPALARGSVDLLDVELRTSAPLGLLVAVARRASPAEMLVRPRPEPLSIALPGRVGEGGRPQLSSTGVDVQGVREWRHGDSARHLYARGTARHGTPVVLDRHDERDDAVAVVLGGPTDHPLWEALVAVVAGVLVDAAGEGRRRAAFVAGRPHAPLIDAGADEALDWCARLEEPPVPSPADIVAAARMVGGGGALVVASTGWSANAPWWRACVNAAESTGVELIVLHPSHDHADALCLHRTGASPQAAGSHA